MCDMNFIQISIQIENLNDLFYYNNYNLCCNNLYTKNEKKVIKTISLY